MTKLVTPFFFKRSIHLASRTFSVFVFLLLNWLYLSVSSSSQPPMLFSQASVLGCFSILTLSLGIKCYLLTLTFLSLAPTSLQSSRLVYPTMYLTSSFWRSKQISQIQWVQNKVLISFLPSNSIFWYHHIQSFSKSYHQNSSQVWSLCLSHWGSAIT